MGKKKEKEKNMKNQDTDQAKKNGFEHSFEHFLAATTEELFLAINELPDGIILEMYFGY